MQGGSFTNAGTLGIGIAGASDYGVFTMTAGGMFKAGGTLAPTLSGYSPAKGTEFQLFQIGSLLRHLRNGHRRFQGRLLEGDREPGVRGRDLRRASSAAGKRPKISKVSGGAAKVMVKVSCAKGKACEAHDSRDCAKKLTVASGGGTAKPGKSATVTVKLNKNGTKLLKRYGTLKVRMTIKAGGKTIRSASVTVTKSSAKKHG